MQKIIPYLMSDGQIDVLYKKLSEAVQVFYAARYLSC
jgi:hypothetical protein